MVHDVGCTVRSGGFRVYGVGFRVKNSEFSVFSVECLNLRV